MTQLPVAPALIMDIGRPAPRIKVGFDAPGSTTPAAGNLDSSNCALAALSARYLRSISPRVVITLGGTLTAVILPTTVPFCESVLLIEIASERLGDCGGRDETKTDGLISKRSSASHQALVRSVAIPSSSM